MVHILNVIVVSYKKLFIYLDWVVSSMVKSIGISFVCKKVFLLMVNGPHIECDGPHIECNCRFL